MCIAWGGGGGSAKSTVVRAFAATRRKLSVPATPRLADALGAIGMDIDAGAAETQGLNLDPLCTLQRSEYAIQDGVLRSMVPVHVGCVPVAESLRQAAPPCARKVSM